MLYEGTFAQLKRRVSKYFFLDERRSKYFFFDECFAKGASERRKRNAMREIYQTILRKYPVAIPESVLHLKIAIASCLYRDLKDMRKVAKVLGCSQSSVLRYIPKEIKKNGGFSNGT